MKSKSPVRPTPPDLPEKEQKREYIKDMFNRIAKRYDLLNRIITFGMDRRWRRKTMTTMTTLASNPNGVYADLACGTGDFTFHKLIRKAHVVSFDFSTQMLSKAQERGNRYANKQVARHHLVCADLATLPVHNQSFEGAVMGFALRNLSDIDSILTEIARILKPDAPLCLLEVGTPKNPFIKNLHSFYFFKVVPLIGKLLSDGAAYKYLPSSVKFLPSAASLEKSLTAAGFSQITTTGFSGNIATLTTAIRS